MAVRVGNTEIASLGKIKLGNTNITKVFRGSVQIFPSVFTYEIGNEESASGTNVCSLATSYTNRYSNTSNLVVGSVIYTDINLTTLWNGFNNFRCIRIQGTSVGNAYKVNNNGVVIEIL